MSDYLKKREQHIMAGRPLKEKKKYSIPNKSAKLVQKEKEQAAAKDEETELQKWYARIMAFETPVCWETGSKINKEDKRAWQGSVAHVLPKKLFPSVATHPKNYLILQMYGGAHGQYDSSWHNAQKMKVWPIAVGRFLMIEPDIAPDERKYIPDCLLIELQKRNPFPKHIFDTDY